jgi:4-hydroxybenzoate polyprenyltransferase
MVYFPHLFGLLFAAIITLSKFLETLCSGAILAGGSLFFSNAAHVWDDLIDAPLDALIERTRHRPIPRKTVSRKAASMFTSPLAICALAFFVWFPHSESILYAFPSIIGTTYYPFSKRHSNFPQLVLGFCLS